MTFVAAWGVGLERSVLVLTGRISANGEIIEHFLCELDESLDHVRPPVQLPSAWGYVISFVRAGSEYVFAESTFNATGEHHLVLHYLDRAGVELRPPVLVAALDGPDASFSQMAALPSGDLVITYSRGNGLPPTNSYVLVLAPDGTPRRGEQLVNPDDQTAHGIPLVATAPDGTFLVVWQHSPEVDNTNLLLGRRFAADGTPLGDPFPVNDVVELDQRWQSVAADAHGNYFVAWQAFATDRPETEWDIRGRLFRRDGTPVTRAIRLNQDRQYEQQLVNVTFAPHGVVLAGWDSASLRQLGPVVRRFAASPSEEICATWGGRLRCHLGREGGTLQFVDTAVRRGEATLMGDVDRDGRDDVCTYRDNNFLCDVAHEGVTNDWTAKFGFPGDVPLLGDVDGDGRADACVRRRKALICDPRHDGTESFRLELGHGGETPRLGDVDGDGRADLCLVDGAYWSCHLSSTGERWQVVFDRAGGSVALGDVDMDGKVDPCVLRRGVLTCATRHDGSPPSYRLQLDVPAGAVLSFGNLDGL